jgi:hypothetical protein
VLEKKPERPQSAVPADRSMRRRGGGGHLWSIKTGRHASIMPET